MPARFDFSLDDLLSNSDDPILNQIHKDSPNPYYTTASKIGNSGRLSTLSMGQIMMGYPLYGNAQDALQTQDLVFTHLLAGTIADKGGDSPDNTLNAPKGFNAELNIPEDILANAKKFKAKYASMRPKRGGGKGGGKANQGVPDDVANSEAFKHTDPNGPNVEAFLQLALQQQGDDYNASGGEIRGITDDPNPGSFDCSGLVWWGLNQLGVKDFPNLSDAQFFFCQQAGCEITVDQAKRTRGALVFIIGHHVEISLGDGTQIGAHNYPYNKSAGGPGGVSVLPFWDGSFDHAALIPELNYHQLSSTASGGATGTEEVNTVSGVSSDVFSGHDGNEGAKAIWAVYFLEGLGAPTNQNNIVSIISWELGENTDAQFNPLATTQKWPGSFGFNSNGGFPVQNYLTADDGFNATIQTITNGHYDNVLNDLRAGAAPEQTMGHFAGGPSGGQDLNTWGTGYLPYNSIPHAQQIYLDNEVAIAETIFRQR